MHIKNSVLDYIRYKKLNWYDHVQRIDEERLPRRNLEWCPSGKRRRKGRLRIFVDAGSNDWKERDWN